MIKRIIVALVGALSLILVAGGCASDADRVSKNLSTDAEQFNVQRTIVFYNGITGEYIAVIEGLCSIERTAATDTEAAKMQATCKVGDNAYTRDEVGLSDNVTYFAMQTQANPADPYHKKIVLKPGNALPDFDVETGSR